MDTPLSSTPAGKSVTSPVTPMASDLSVMRQELHALSAAQKALRSPAPRAAAPPSREVQEQMSKLQAGVLAHSQAVATFERSRRAAEDALRRAAASVQSSPMPLHSPITPAAARGNLLDDGLDQRSSRRVASPLVGAQSGTPDTEAARDMERGMALAAEVLERGSSMVSPYAYPEASPKVASPASIDSRLLGAAIERSSELTTELEACRSELAEALNKGPADDGRAERLQQELTAAKEHSRLQEAELEMLRKELAAVQAELVEAKQAAKAASLSSGAAQAAQRPSLAVVQAETVGPSDPPMPVARASFAGLPETTAEIAQPGEGAVNMEF